MVYGCIKYLGILLVVILLGANPSSDQMIANGVGQGKEVVSRGGYVSVLHQGVVKVPIERGFDVGDILYLRNTAHADLLPTVGI